MKSFSDFDSVFCINLDRRTDRWADAKKELELCGITNSQRFSAIEFTVEAAGTTRANKGCTASHRALWDRLARGELGGNALIFEDDFQFITERLLWSAGYGGMHDVMKIFKSVSGESFHDRLNALLPHVPENWDLLYLGGGYACDPVSRVNTHIIRSGGMLTTHAYAISRAYAEVLTSRLDVAYGTERPIGDAPDTLLRNFVAYPDWSGVRPCFAYVLSPRLFVQRQGVKSDISGEMIGFPHSMVDCRHEMMV